MTVSGEDAVQLGFDGTYSYKKVESKVGSDDGYWTNDDHSGFTIHKTINDEWEIYNGVELVHSMLYWNGDLNNVTSLMEFWLGKIKVYTPLKCFFPRELT